MEIKKITQLPTPPSSKDAASFDTRADAFVESLPSFVNDVNEIIDVLSVLNPKLIETGKNEYNKIKELGDSKFSALEDLWSNKDILIKNLSIQKINELQLFKDEKIKELSEFAAEEIYDEYVRAFENQYKENLSNILFAEFATLKNDVERIKNYQMSLGSNFMTQTFNTNGEFMLKEGVNYYFVQVSGGSGLDNSSISGSPSSFGEYLSANGGAPNPSGVGRLGDVVCSLLSFPSTKENLEIELLDEDIELGKVTTNALNKIKEELIALGLSKFANTLLEVSLVDDVGEEFGSIGLIDKIDENGKKIYTFIFPKIIPVTVGKGGSVVISYGK